MAWHGKQHRCRPISRLVLMIISRLSLMLFLLSGSLRRSSAYATVRRAITTDLTLVARSAPSPADLTPRPAVQEAVVREAVV